jgi:hypothetical protein
LLAVALFILLGGIWLARQNKNDQLAQINNGNQNNSVEPSPEPPPELNRSNASAANQNAPVVNKTNERQKSEKTPDAKPSVAPGESQNRQKPPVLQPQPTFLTFTLLPPTRSAEKPVLAVSAAEKNIRLQVVHDNEKEFIKYRAEIRSPDGDLIWSRELPVTRRTLRKPLALNVRNGALASGSYELTLSGITAGGELEEINYYNFSVSKK